MFVAVLFAYSVGWGFGFAHLSVFSKTSVLLQRFQLQLLATWGWNSQADIAVDNITFGQDCFTNGEPQRLQHSLKSLIGSASPRFRIQVLCSPHRAHMDQLCQFLQHSAVLSHTHQRLQVEAIQSVILQVLFFSLSWDIL